MKSGETRWSNPRDLTQPPLLLITRPKTVVSSSTAQLRAEPEIVKLAEYIFARAHEILDRTKPIPHTDAVSARQFQFDDHQKRHEIRQTELVAHPDKQDRWNQTRVVAFRENSRWSLSANDGANPRLLELDKSPFEEVETSEFSLDDADRVMNKMRKALEAWLNDRSGDGFFEKNILPKWDRANGFIQGLSHRAFRPKD